MGTFEKQEEFKFLELPALYNELYNKKLPITTESFCFKPLTATSIQKNKLWKAYINFSDDHWALQTPLVGHFKRSLDIDLMAPFDCTTDISVWVYLSSLGWSTNVDIRLRGNLIKNDIIDLIGRLRSTPNREQMPFKWAGPKSLTDIFIQCQNTLAKEVYHSPSFRGKEYMRHFVISVNRFSGEITPFHRMTHAEKGLLLRLLFGVNINATDYIEIEQNSEDGPYKHSKIDISGPNFAITSFKHGTFLFIQKTRFEGQVHCLHKNVRDMIMLALTKLDFIGETKGASSETLLGTLAENSLNNLKRLQQNYSNKFCQGFFEKHGSLPFSKLN
jgi:hypothetical protein